MKRQMTPGETLREFCRAWFVQRDAERTLAFLTEDVGFVGTGTDEMASGRQQMAGYLAQDIREIPEPFECELSPIYEQPVADGIYNMSADLTLKNSKYTWYLRAFFTLVLSGEEWLVMWQSRPAARRTRSIIRGHWSWNIPADCARSF